MTPAEESYAAAWLAEMWKPTKEYHQTDGERADAWSRNTQVPAQAGDDTQQAPESRAS